LLLGKQAPVWGGVFTRFEDIDKNSFALVSFDEMTQAVESQRRATAQKLESERRAAHELEIAKQVQARLFPQIFPPLRTLDYAGACIQARQVGGDYYDFLNLGQERLGMVLGDISGKGIAGALLMANLQANLRSQCIAGLDDTQRLLRCVNQLFYDNTADNAYATLFFAEYDDQAQRLRYANCGHLSGLLLRGDNSLERLDSTSTVLGLFKEWDCSNRGMPTPVR
jgi:serine phosphatase RsbU (regulator of sigma subunit)